MLFSLIIPAYNEEGKILRDMEAAREYLSVKAFSSEVLLVNDGSLDQTQRVIEANLERLSTDKVTFRSCGYGQNRGKGYAVRHGVEQAKGDVIAFADSGLCVPFLFLDEGIAQVRAGADYAIASRRLPGTKIVVQQPLYRKLGSKIFWFVIQGFMGIKVSDTQCGFKVYSAKAAKAIYSRLKTNGFMFDIEALVLAKRFGFKEAEFPVHWSNDSDTRYDPIWGTLRNFRELLVIRLRSFR